MMIMFFTSIILAVILILLNSLISLKSSSDREKITPFECGYDPKNMSRLPFSLHFYLLAVIFLIFDIEITIIMPMPLIIMSMNMYLWILLTIMFILILAIGTIHEWKEGALNWVE
uniref:NADH-ubiquinone oxidoreductase chain 3 n=1 Tax=Ptenothrix huangshanensis TaxID=2583244 RepID=A0A6H0EYC8_9HEXA|nr:NADH dehydrogenase subunit 3 [Ptenothrix huangshanensis]